MDQNQNLSKTQKKKEIRELKKKIDKKRKECNDQRLKFQKQERDRERAERFHNWQLEEIIQEQQKVVREAEIARKFSNHFYSNYIHEINPTRQNYKRSHPVENDEPEIFMRPSQNQSVRKRISSNNSNLSNSQQFQVQVNIQIEKQQKGCEVNGQEKRQKEQVRNSINETPKKNAFEILMQSNQKKIKEWDTPAEDNHSQEEPSGSQNEVSRPRSQFSDNFDQYSYMDRDISYPQAQSQNEPISQQQQPLIAQNIGGNNDNQSLNEMMRIVSQQTAKFNDIPQSQQHEQQFVPQERDQQQSHQQQESKSHLDKDDIDKMMMEQQLYDSQDDSDYMGQSQQPYEMYSEENPDHPKGYIACFAYNKPVYATFSEKKKGGIQDNREISIPPHAHYLLHRNIGVKMQELVKYNWKNLLEITFTTAQLTNKAFKLFADNYEKYPNIKILYLSYNSSLTTVTVDMLKKFEKLEYINFGDKENTCYLSKQSIAEIQKYQAMYPDVDVFYYKKPEQITDDQSKK